MDLVPLQVETLEGKEDPLGRFNAIASAIHWRNSVSRRECSIQLIFLFDHHLL